MTGDLQEPHAETGAAGSPAPSEPPSAADETAAAPADPRAADLAALKERLKARGVLTDVPAVVIPKEPRPAVSDEDAPTSDVDDGVDGVDHEPHWAESPYDAWDVDPGPAPETVDVACPRCRAAIAVPLQATRVSCASCDLSWRYGVCEQCRKLDLTMERQESWRCHDCGHFSRSWWRTPSHRLLALNVLARRQEAIAVEQRRIVREGMRMRRWKLIVFGVVASLAVAIFVLSTRAAEPDGASGRAAACQHFRSILEDVAAGRMPPAELDAELEELELEVEGEGAELAAAVSGMRAASGPTAPEFISSRAAFVDACGPDFAAR